MQCTCALFAIAPRQFSSFFVISLTPVPFPIDFCVTNFGTHAQWMVGPGEQANSKEAIAKGAVPGQVHFFPAISNVKQLKQGFESHGCAKL